MCGIAGIFIRSGPSDHLPETIRRMTDQLIHRGPDDSGYFCGGSIALGHRRLSIIDLGSGAQPMFNEDRSMAIVFNGEIYNYLELKGVLEGKGHRFQTKSDTEVILHAYEEWGEESPSYLRGMFAYAIWDSRTVSLFLARDRFGKKPLYYAETEKYLLFASEIKSLLQYPGIGRDIDIEALYDYLSYLYIPSPKSIFKGIRKLPPAHSMTVTENGLKIREYWDIPFNPECFRSEPQFVEELSSRIREAVKIRLMSEVPLGAFLSGGLDSSLVVAFMAGLMTDPVLTNSIGFREEKFSELPYAREVASLFKTSHHEFLVDTDATSILEKLAWFYDEPFADSSSIPTYHVCRVARNHVTVALSGDGGDENFGGYRRYFFDLLENRIRSFISPGIRRRVFGTVGRAYPKADWLPRVFRAKTLLMNLATSPEEGYFRTMSAFPEEMKHSLVRSDILEKLAGYNSFSVLEPHFSRSRGLDPLSRVQYVDMKTYLPDDILTKVDRASMANSLEVRAPLLDHEVAEFAATIPASLKIKGRTKKYVLKKVANGILPDPLVHREKMGFSIPLDLWLRNDLKFMVSDLLMSPSARVSEYFNPGFVEKMWKDHGTGQRNYGTHLFALLTFEAWHRRHIG